MATALKTYEEFLDEITPGSQTQPGGGPSYNLSGDMATAPAPPAMPSSAPTAQPAASSAPTAAPKAPAAAPPGAPAPSSFQAPQTSNPLYSNIFKPVSSTLGEAFGTLEGAQSEFEQKAGPSRTFESIGGRDTIFGALSGDQAARNKAGSLVKAQYQGPQGLDDKALADLFGAKQAIGGVAPTLRSAGTIGGLLEKATPGLTAGERAFETRRIQKDQGYRDAARQLEEEARRFSSSLTSGQETAEAFAKQRKGEEEDIRKQSFGVLEGEKSRLHKDLAGRADAQNKIADELTAAYDAVRRNPQDQAALAALAEKSKAFGAGDFENETLKQKAEAEAKRQAILDDPRFAAIKDVPLMQLGLTSHGREGLFFDPEWWKENKQNYAKGKQAPWGGMTRADLKALARERQRELEQAGFSPGTAAIKDSRRADAREMGEYGIVDPLYFTEGLEALDDPGILNYLNLQLGGRATRSSVSTDQERQLDSVLAEFLGQPRAIRDERVDPSVVQSDAERYQQDIADALTRRTEQLEGASADWRKTTRKARGEVRDRRLGDAISRVTGDTMGHTLAGMAKGDPKAAANLPFAVASFPLTNPANPQRGQGEKMTQKASLVKTPRKIKTGARKK